MISCFASFVFTSRAYSFLFWTTFSSQRLTPHYGFEPSVRERPSLNKAVKAASKLRGLPSHFVHREFFPTGPDRPDDVDELPRDDLTTLGYPTMGNIHITFWGCSPLALVGSQSHIRMYPATDLKFAKVQYLYSPKNINLGNYGWRYK
jgi:hypothetical protein